MGFAANAISRINDTSGAAYGSKLNAVRAVLPPGEYTGRVQHPIPQIVQNLQQVQAEPRGYADIPRIENIDMRQLAAVEDSPRRRRRRVRRHVGTI